MNSRIRLLVAVCGATLTGALLTGPATAAPAAEDSRSRVPVAAMGAGDGTKAADLQAKLCTGAFDTKNPQLGPATNTLPGPAQKPVGPLLKGYDRTGKLKPDAFLSAYWTGKPTWKYPPDDGFARHGGKLDKNKTRLKAGQKLDRFGHEGGSFLAPAGAPYSQRALPPDSLQTIDDKYPCNYHVYTVAKPFTVWQGGIAAWFEQPGGGLQIQLDPALVPGAPTPKLSVKWLIDNGYLTRTGTSAGMSMSAGTSATTG
ncbi:TNT domain-containing protein [Streptomyces sp. UNOB3_S3]|uniref:TNT domain-containing protein n=1 Tax=Streptomyces sp. UNOB3_S3 TaxID=2871682 RepID=UPI001E6038B6|nr:TNT domain-containing protein [Streptomyces sp. UNOB3_S3]MCC3776785.1 TNT domain-containing protein [Streptomyces sp. UNOB3_S3]